jgi:hypothetical protein
MQYAGGDSFGLKENKTSQNKWASSFARIARLARRHAVGLTFTCISGSAGFIPTSPANEQITHGTGQYCSHLQSIYALYRVLIP